MKIENVKGYVVSETLIFIPFKAPVTTTQAPKTTEPSLKNLLGEVKPTQSPTTAQNLNNMLGFPRVDA